MSQQRTIHETTFDGAISRFVTDAEVSETNDFNPPVVVSQQWELHAQFAERPMAVVAIMPDGSVHRLDRSE